MRIGIDVSQAVYGTGVGDYTKNLVDQLTSIDKSDTFVLFGGSLRKRSEFPRLFPQKTNVELKTSILITFDGFGGGELQLKFMRSM